MADSLLSCSPSAVASHLFIYLTALLLLAGDLFLHELHMAE